MSFPSLAQTLFPLECSSEDLLLAVEVGLPPASGPAVLWDEAYWDGATWSPAPDDVPTPLWDFALWDDAYWTYGENWVDLSDRIRSVSMAGSFSEDLDSWSSRTANIVLDNRDGALSPDNDNPLAPYVVGGKSGVRPGVPVRVRLQYGTICKSIITGTVESWEEEWAGHSPGEGDAVINIYAVDSWSDLSKIVNESGSPAGAGEILVQRVTRILSSVSYPGVINSDAGSATLQATDLSGSIVDNLNLTSQSEGGSMGLWVGGDGALNARDKNSLLEDENSTVVQCTFGDGVGEIPWSDIGVSPLTAERVINRAQYSCVGGTLQTVQDPLSVAMYGLRDDAAANIDSLICETDAQALALAQWRVLLRKDARALVTNLEVKPGCDIDTFIPVLLGLDLRYLVEVIIRPPTDYSHIMRRSCFIRGEEYNIANGDLTIKYQFADADTHRLYADSRWDVATWDESKWHY